MSSEQPSAHFPGEAGWWSLGCDNGRECSFTIHRPFIERKWEELKRVKGGQELSWKRGGVATFAPNFSTAQEELGEGSEGA